MKCGTYMCLIGLEAAAASNLKRPWPWEMAAILRVWKSQFAFFFKYVWVISTKVDRDIARDKGQEFDPGKIAIWVSEIAFLHFLPMYFSYSNETL